MTRDEMINVLLENLITNWIYMQDTGALEEFLLFGNWKPLDNYTGAELKSEIKYFDDEQIKDYLKSCRERRIREKIIWKENKKRLEKWEVDHKAIDPFE